MMRAALIMAIFACASAASALAQVHSVGDVSFAVPDGWQYQQGSDVGAMTMKSDTRFWVLAVYSAMPSSGDPISDFRAAWQRVVLAGPDYHGIPNYGPYDITKTVGYLGKYYDDSSVNRTTYTRLYVLEAGGRCVPVAFVSTNRQVLDGMQHNALAVVGSVRVAPLRASPIKYSIKVSDLVGHWTGGIATSVNYYNSGGQYQSNSLTAVSYEYTIATDGSYTYKLGGMLNNRATSDNDTGAVELGGEFITFKGQRRTQRYRFVNIQQALDGSSVITLWPPVDMSKIDSSRDTEYMTRLARQ